MTPRSRGFTLIELLVALFVAALMFTMGYGAIRQGLTGHDRLKAFLARIEMKHH